MRYLPYRDLDAMGGGSTVEEKKSTRKRKPWVYQSEYDNLMRECLAWKRAFIYSLWVIAAFIIAFVVDQILAV
jgi:hypothetical protein